MGTVRRAIWASMITVVVVGIGACQLVGFLRRRQVQPDDVEVVRRFRR